MKFLLGIMDRIRPAFRDGGRLRALRPVFDAIDSFLFSVENRTETAPHVRDPLDVKRYMTTAIIAVLPCVAAAVYFFGLRVLLMIAVTYAAGLAVEALFSIVRKEELNEGFFVTGMIYPLVLPPALPLWMVALGVVVGVILGKELFGGTGRNLFNPALVGRVFLALAYPAAMSSNWIEPAWGGTGRLAQYVDASTVDAISSATPLVLAKQGEFAPATGLFFGSVPGSAGETSALLVVAGGLFLLFTRVGNWRTVASILGSFAALGAVLHHLAPDVFGPVGWHLLAGGLLFGAFFMATDPVTSPVTNGGKWAYGIIIGVSTVLIRHLTGYVEGVMFAILLGNIFAPVLDEVVVRHRLWSLRNEG
jgi:Na(+)-translocating NADH:ubiquinone oxidoreductase B subunit